MADKTGIQWTDSTQNFWTGCKKVSAGCKYCYMYRDKERWNQKPEVVLRTAPATFNAPLRWKYPRRVFTCSWSDFFIEEADEWRADAWDIIRQTPQHQWQILTKRPERIMQCLPPDWGEGWANVWLGVSVENEQFTSRIAILQKVPAATRFLSIEPLIGPVNLHPWLIKPGRFNMQDEVEASYVAQYWKADIQGGGIHWVIIGGESGNDEGKWKYRPCYPEWIGSVLEACFINSVPVFMKQTGTYLAKKWNLVDRHGGDLTEWPEDTFKVRQMPDTPAERAVLELQRRFTGPVGNYKKSLS